MKTTRYITALGLAMLALAACTNEDEMPGGKLPEGAVHITAHIEGAQTRAPQLDADGKGNFAQGDIWGMYAYTDAAAPGENREYKYQETVLYWKDLSETSPVTFSAHYPRITGSITDPAAYLYMPEDWKKTDDLLHATVTASKGGTVALTFKHLMHRLIVNLIAGEGMAGVNLSSALINSTAKDGTPTMFASVEVNLLTGTVNYDHVENGIFLSNGGNGNADWKVAPQDLAVGAEWLRIRVGEDTWYYNVPTTLNSSNPNHPTRLESGKQLTLNLTLKKNQQTGQTEVELTSSEIYGWGTQGTITDDVVIGGDTPADGNIDMNGKTVDEVKAAIEAALNAGITELKLTGPITNSGIDGSGSNSPFVSNTQVTKIDLSEATGWPTVSYVGSTSSPDNEKGLPAFAFFDCGKLEEVKLPAEVKAIGAMAFIGCTSLTVINLENVTHIGGQSFEGCKALTVIDMSKVTTIYQAAFRGTGLTALSLPKATSISEGIPDNNIGSGMGSFSGCKQLVSVEAPLLTSTGNKSFSSCSALQTVNLPMLKEIKAYAFSECPLLEITSFDNVTSVGERAFFKCTALTELTLPKATRIDIFTFMDCENLTTLKLPAAVELGNYFVSGCISLTRIEMTAPGRITYLDGDDLLDKAVFGNFGDTKFNVADCNLVLNKDKEEGGAGTPPASGNTWIQYDWKSISYQQ